MVPIERGRPYVRNMGSGDPVVLVHGGPLDVETVEQSFEVADRRVRSGGDVGAAVTPAVVADDPEGPGELSEQMVPDPAVRETVVGEDDERDEPEVSSPRYLPVLPATGRSFTGFNFVVPT